MFPILHQWAIWMPRIYLQFWRGQFDSDCNSLMNTSCFFLLFWRMLFLNDYEIHESLKFISYFAAYFSYSSLCTSRIYLTFWRGRSINSYIRPMNDFCYFAILTYAVPKWLYVTHESLKVYLLFSCVFFLQWSMYASSLFDILTRPSLPAVVIGDPWMLEVYLPFWRGLWLKERVKSLCRALGYLRH